MNVSKEKEKIVSPNFNISPSQSEIELGHRSYHLDPTKKIVSKMGWLRLGTGNVLEYLKNICLKHNTKGKGRELEKPQSLSQ